MIHWDIKPINTTDRVAPGIQPVRPTTPLSLQSPMEAWNSPPAIGQSTNWNGPPTLRGYGRFGHLATTKKEELKFAQNQIQVTDQAIKASVVAISTLQNTINSTRHAVTILERSQKSLGFIHNDIEGLDATYDAISLSSSEHPAPDICQAVAALIGRSDSTDELPLLADQYHRWGATLKQLKEKIPDLKSELREWSSELAFHKGHRQHLETYHRSLQGIINGLERHLSPMWKTPTEVWIKIFEYSVIDRDLTASRLSLPSTLVLGHVCSQWRAIVFGTPNLWRRCDLYPFTWWSHPLLNMFTQYRKSAGNTGQVWYHMSSPDLPVWGEQARQSSKSGQLYRYRSSTFRELVQISSKELSAISSIWLHLSQWSSLDDFTLLPSANFRNVVLQGNSDGMERELAIFLNSLTSVEALKMEDIWLANGAEPITMPNLKRLAFRFTQFTSFNISLLLPSALRELDIRHNSSGTVRFSSGITPPLLDLYHLAITPYDHELLAYLKTPSLKRVTLYPVSESLVDVARPQESEISDNSDSVPNIVGCLISSLIPKLHTVEEVIFVEWKTQVTDMDCVYILERLLGVPSPLCHLIFDGCHLDGPALISCLAKANGKKVDIEELLASEGPLPSNMEAHSVSSSSRFKSLGELTLSSCTGITRDESDILASTVGKLNIYI